MIPRVSLLTLGVRNLDRSVGFYEDIFGWKKSPASQDDVIFFQVGGLVVSLYPLNLLAEDARIDAANDGFAGVAFAYNAASENEVNQIFGMLREKGVTILKAPEKAFWGGYSGYFADPDGYAWEVAHNPFFPRDEHGELRLPTAG